MYAEYEVLRLVWILLSFLPKEQIPMPSNVWATSSLPDFCNSRSCKCSDSFQNRKSWWFSWVQLSNFYKKIATISCNRELWMKFQILRFLRFDMEYILLTNLVAKSRWTKLSDSRYFIPEAIWVARYIRHP